MSTLDSLLAQRDRLDARIERVANRPVEPEPDGDGCAVVWFKVRFHSSRSSDRGWEYSYAAVLAGSRWYLSGPQSPPSGTDWDSMLEYLEGRGAEFVCGPFVATEWTAL